MQQLTSTLRTCIGLLIRDPPVHAEPYGWQLRGVFEPSCNQKKNFYHQWRLLKGEVQFSGKPLVPVPPTIPAIKI